MTHKRPFNTPYPSLTFGHSFISIAAAAPACIAAYAPVALAVGVPIELLPLCFADDTIPGMLAPAANVTADVSIAMILTEGATENAGGDGADE